MPPTHRGPEERARLNLLDVLRPRDTVYSIERHLSRTAATGHYDFLIIRATTNPPGYELRYITREIMALLSLGSTPRGYIITTSKPAFLLEGVAKELFHNERELIHLTL